MSGHVHEVTAALSQTRLVFASRRTSLRPLTGGEEPSRVRAAAPPAATPAVVSEATPSAEETRETADRRLTRLVQEYLPSVFRALRRFGLTPADADDGVQEVFLVAARRLDAIVVGSERAFLLATAARVASSRRRSLRRRQHSEDDELDVLCADDPSPEELSSYREARVLLDRTLADMDADARVAFVLHELEHLTTPAIAAALGVPEGTVSTRLRRARQVFQAAVAREAQRRRAEEEP